MLPLWGKEEDEKTTNLVADKWRNPIGDGYHKLCPTTHAKRYITFYVASRPRDHLRLSLTPLGNMSEVPKNAACSSSYSILRKSCSEREFIFFGRQKNSQNAKNSASPGQYFCRLFEITVNRITLSVSIRNEYPRLRKILIHWHGFR